MSDAACLVVDTIGPWCACAVQAGGRTTLRSEDIGRGHAERLALMVQAALADAGIRPVGLSRIGVNTGPGGFAATRVGVAFVRGLALSTSARALGVSNLDAVARRADPDGARMVMAVHDARRGDLVWRFYNEGQPMAGVRYGDVHAARSELETYDDVILTGPGAALLGVDSADFDPAPPLDALLALTAEAGAEAPLPSPLYARPPDVKLRGA